MNLRERAVDIETWTYDKCGDPGFIHDISTGSIHWDRKRSLRYCANRAGQVLAQSMLAPADLEDVLNEAVSLVRAARINEAQDDNTATQGVLHSKELNESYTKRALSSFADKIDQAKGLRGAVQKLEAISITEGEEINMVIYPQMDRQAQAQAKESIGVIDRCISQRMRTPNGLSATQQYLAYLRTAVEKSKESISQEEADIHERRAPHQHIVAEASDQLERISQGGWLVRARSLLLIRRINPSIEQSGRALISTAVELAACHITKETFLGTVLDHIDARLAWLTLYAQKLLRVAQTCSTAALAAADESTVLTVPNGFELATPENLKNRFHEHVENSGGLEQFEAQIRSLFLTEYDSFAALAEAPEQDITEALVTLGSKVFEPTLEGKTVWDELNRLYDEDTQRQMILQIVHQSEGRLVTEGEVGKNVVWIKAGNVPCQAAVGPVGQLLDAVDPKAGRWDLAVDNDPETISITQLRGGISATPLIDRVELPDTPEGWKKAMSKAVNFVTAIMPPPNPKRRQLQRVMAKALVTGILTVDEKGNYNMTSPSGQEIALGKDISDIEKKIRHDYRQIVFIESAFARHLLIAEQRIMERLENQHRSALSQESAENTPLQLTTAKGIEECIKQAELLLPRLRRLKKCRDYKPATS